VSEVIVTAEINIPNIGAIPANFAHTNDPTMYVDDEILLVATFHNGGDVATGQFKIMLILDGSNVHEEWIHDLHPGAHHNVAVPWRGLGDGGHELEALADVTHHVNESDLSGNMAKGEFVILGSSRKDEYVDEPGTTIQDHLTDKQWLDAGWKKATVHLSVWDFAGNPLSDYDVMVRVEGQTEWIHPEHPMQEGAATFPKMFVHPSGQLNVHCQARGANAFPQLSGVFDTPINTDQAVVIHAWQHAEPTQWTDSDVHTHTAQWQVTGSESIKGGFKILDIGVESNTTVGGSYGQSDADAHGRSKTYRVWVASAALYPQTPQRPF